MYKEAAAIKQFIDDAERIVIWQADNPDGDSLGSALALESILGDLGKNPWLYCGVDIPAHLRYLPGWDRVTSELPNQFDLSIVVDTSALSLFEQASRTGQVAYLKQKPLIVLDHHDVESTLDFAQVICNQPVVSSGELIYELAQQLDWPLGTEAKNAITISILSDSLGLMTEATSARSIEIISQLVASGVSLPQLEQARRQLMRKSVPLTHYKGQLLQRVEYHADNRVATVNIPWEEIQTYSPEYNPSMLVMEDMRLTDEVAVAIAFKEYPSGRLTAKIRCNNGWPIANDLASHFGGGGHKYASGFKVQDGRSFSDVKSACIAYATELLNNLTSLN